MRSFLFAVAVACVLAPNAEAGKWRRARAAACQPAGYYLPAPMPNPYYPAAPQAAPMPSPAPSVAPAQVTAGDTPGAFLAWLNGMRGRCGLPALGYDASLEPYAAENNARCSRWGLNHWAANLGWWSCAAGPVAPTAIYTPLEDACRSWMSSSAHRSALLRPDVRACGISTNGTYWTVNLR